ncbi:toll/interleukin-1 receptor domain-containing protein [Priestia megaterium]|uniref:toll/interleukin-1 receptor domain-containing protein n=1 Tax=Priestia megaterium TaxID=1404 RepID=UPI0015D4B9E3|nr:toll/interleukin-1 receptor domain-containing protein [Priestia megaterium]
MIEERKLVFLSHSSKNADIVKEIADYLETHNIPCWYAQRDIPTGDQYYMRIIEDLEHRVGPVIVFITEEVATSRNVPKEIDRAIFYDKPIIPLLINGTAVPKKLEYFLCDIQWIDLQAEGSEKLVETLEEIYEGRKIQRVSGVSKKTLNQPFILKSQSNVLLYKINERYLEKVKHIYEPFSNMIESRRKLEGENGICLYHQAHTGKFASAIALLQSLGIKELYQWSSEVTPKEMIYHRLKPNMGMILEIDDPEFFHKFSYHELEEYMNRLKGEGSFIVFISTFEPTQPFLKDISVNVNLPDNSLKMLKKHIQWDEADASLRNRMINWLETREAANLLPHQFFPNEISNLMRKIRDFILGNIDLSHFKNSLHTSVETRVKNRFKQNLSSKDISFYLSLGLFEGQTAPVIREKARMFNKLIQEDLGLLLQQSDQHVPGDEYLASFHTEVKPKHVYTDTGLEIRNEVYFTFPEDAYHVWQYVWTQMDEFQELIVKMIKTEFHGGNGLNNRIIDLLVGLSYVDFSRLREKIIQPLASSSVTRERWLAVRLLEKMIDDDHQHHKLFKLVKSWIGLRNNPRLQWTATVLLGGKLGIKYFPKSMTMLQNAYLSNPKPLYYTVQKSMQQLSQLALVDNNYETLYFKFFEKWFSETEEQQLPSILRFAHGIFLQNVSLFFKTSSNRLIFWFSFFNALYMNPSQNILLEKMCISALEIDEYKERLLKLLSMIKQHGYDSSKDRIQIFLDTEIGKLHSQLFHNKFIEY